MTDFRVNRPSEEQLDDFAVFWWGPETEAFTIEEAIENGQMTAFAEDLLAHWGK